MSENKRSIYLRVDEIRGLDHWCHLLTQAVPTSQVYLVGSVLERPDHRDVDVRVLLRDKKVRHLPMKRLDLNMLLSQWGQRLTGLPIDCQIQSYTEAAEFDDRPMNPRWIQP